MTAHSIKEAWAMANEIFPTDYDYDAATSARAGYPVYSSTSSDCRYAHISDLNARLEVCFENGDCVNIWIEEDEPADVEPVEVEPVEIDEMVRMAANVIAGKYSRWLESSEISAMYDELNAIGIQVPPIVNRRDVDASSYRCTGEILYKGAPVENSVIVFSVYAGSRNTARNEYNIYFT